MMTLSRREQFAAAALPGLLARTPHLDLSPTVDLAFFVADEAMALSAPDAIEALRDLVEALDSFGGNTWHPDILTPTKAAKAVLARYKKKPE